MPIPERSGIASGSVQGPESFFLQSINIYLTSGLHDEYILITTLAFVILQTSNPERFPTPGQNFKFCSPFGNKSGNCPAGGNVEW